MNILVLLELDDMTSGLKPTGPDVRPVDYTDSRARAPELLSGQQPAGRAASTDLKPRERCGPHACARIIIRTETFDAARGLKEDRSEDVPT
jgi:hypothetical protein